MNSELNHKTFIWALGVIQPATPNEVQKFVIELLLKQPIKEFDIETTVKKLLDESFIRCVCRKKISYIVLRMKVMSF